MYECGHNLLLSLCDVAINPYTYFCMYDVVISIIFHSISFIHLNKHKRKAANHNNKNKFLTSLFGITTGPYFLLVPACCKNEQKKWLRENEQYMGKRIAK